MTIDSFDTVFYTAVFLLPGFIINNIIDLTNPPPKHKDSIFFLKCFCYSIISCAIWSWLYLLIIHGIQLYETLRWILLISVSLIGSIIIGVILAIIKQYQYFDHLLQKFNVRTIHSIPTAWDYIFSLQESGYIEITLMDDKKKYGLYSCESFTSSDPEERDIFVEQSYRVEDGQWIPDLPKKGFYIPKNQIKMIEFLFENHNPQNGIDDKNGEQNNVRKNKKRK